MHEEPEFDGKALVANLSSSPGVYRMLGRGGELLYVGKAGNLKKRVGSYFLKPAMQPRIAAMIAQIAGIEVTLTRTEAEALLLEAQLIKTLRPRYNILLRDDKSYPYIHLTPGEYPRLAFHRGARDGGGRYFGPYPSALAVRETLSLLQKLFRIRNCEDSYFRNRSRPCLQHQIGRCSAPCVGLIDAADYRASVQHATLFLEGRSDTLIDELVVQMEHASAALEFERAAAIRDRIALVRKINARHYVHGAGRDMDVLACAIDNGVACVSVLFFRDGSSLGSRDFFPRLALDADEGAILASFLAQYYLERPVPEDIVLSHAPEEIDLLGDALTRHAGHRVELKVSVRGDRARFLDMAIKNASAALAARLASRQTLLARFEALRDLLDLDELPQRLECFDISHTMGEATVASCVVFGPEGPEKSQYRRFNISGITGGDDYAAMRQALERRYRRLQAGEARLPDLLLIDGGPGQVRQALDVLHELGVEGVRVVGVAKGDSRRAGHESLILGDSGRVLWPGPDSPASHLIQAVRDEAHRFAISGHRARREKAREASPLQEVAGIGAKRRAALLRRFGGLAGVTRAGVEELMQVKGIHRELAERIYAALHG
ncbi:MAG TPA: excinuclease ABC subunit UvrC [Dokdonella sp.]|uniref:excinuclease ABC subunit UvrC n=1 Tax=Dokdonella sp. TaxID=2291710 RepID=UPI0025C3EB95|nr:excinuclease ABC subunit UvrC [Dokdonella sp.]MBX3693451.1 excinuclease ABC subunit UvrC [Dokdonella sp.]MCW5569251.1 excinuclease ABC subunit UvrC [Dokdonella sp.]HNR91928.1 excinuclease ABC subunit UvrC [Dokdonella sp.]